MPIQELVDRLNDLMELVEPDDVVTIGASPVTRGEYALFVEGMYIAELYKGEKW